MPSRYYKDMSNLIPEARTDKNGHVVVRHVRSDSSAPVKGSPVPPPVISKRKIEMAIMETQFKAYKSNSSITDDMGYNPDYAKMLANLDNLTDIELSRFGLHLDHSDEETVAFLTPLDKQEYDLLSDMTLIYDANRHGGESDDEDGYQEYPVDATDIYLALSRDHEGMKSYMKSQGVNYKKLDALSPENRAKALKWLGLMTAAENMTGALKLEYVRDQHGNAVYEKSFMKFADPEFLELAMVDNKIMEMARIHGVSDLERLKLMISHEASVSGGVL